MTELTVLCLPSPPGTKSWSGGDTRTLRWYDRPLQFRSTASGPVQSWGSDSRAWINAHGLLSRGILLWGLSAQGGAFGLGSTFKRNFRLLL